MTYTGTPRTWVAGETVTAALMNSDVRDPLIMLVNTPRVRVYNSTGPSLTNATATLLSWDTEEINTNTMHSTVTNTSRLVATTAGRYLVIAQAGFASNATGARQVNVRKNAAGSSAGGTGLTSNTCSSVMASNVVAASTFSTFLNAADYLEMFATQTSGGALAVNQGQWSTFFEMVWIGES